MPAMQWSGHRRVSYVSCAFAGFVTVVCDVYGCASGPWFDAKLMWFGGWWSFVATLRMKRSARSSLMAGITARPSGTASEPF